jgi:hypothetical protein
MRRFSVERASWNAGRIEEDDLPLGSVADADDAVPRRLRLRRHDRELHADERVQERRLADVRAPDDGDVPARWWAAVGAHGSQRSVTRAMTSCRGFPGPGARRFTRPVRIGAGDRDADPSPSAVQAPWSSVGSDGSAAIARAHRRVVLGGEAP